MSLKTRFAPSPTGEMHFGNLRTALFNVLAAISHKGSFLLRVEDTDEERSRKEFEELLYTDFRWLGVEWQEGADSNGQHKGDKGPYRQSERKEIYDKYYQELLDNKQAYYCFCSEGQLALSRKLQRSQGLPPRYAGTCANLTSDEVKAKLAQGEEPTVRFKIDKDTEVRFTDRVKGEQVFKSNDIGDFIIRRASGTSSFMFCNAIDDAMMGVSLVMRGEDHLTNTPRQLMILDKLGLNKPMYGHISLIIGNDGSPLSKRHGSKSLKALREEGYLPEAIVNYLARLGHQYNNNLPYSSLEELGKNFSLDNLSKSPAHYDEQHLLYWQKEAVLHISKDRFKAWLGNVLLNCPEQHRDSFADLMQQNIMFPKEAENWSNILFKEDLCLSHEQLELLKSTGREFFVLAKSYIESNKASFDVKELANFIKDKLDVKGKKLFMPLRLSITLVDHGPELVNLVELMGVDRVLTRINKVIEAL